MELSYHGHAAFKLKGSAGTVVTDPFNQHVGLELPSLSADVITVSHHHDDHDNVSAVSGTSRRDRPFIIDQAGEYEVAGISVFGVPSFHDDSQGSERGPNIIFTVLIDGVKVCHLGDLGHQLDKTTRDDIGQVDILLCPVGGTYTIGPEEAISVIAALEPSIVVPMHFRTDRHDQNMFGQLKTLTEFVHKFGTDEPEHLPKLRAEADRLPEETQLVVLSHPG
ncbi:MAG: hypothetical protein COU69_00720 [Candidatus Pacebacteria bacterium CG10_big_fil_rev_8_21_14_0_10_56_10]|nr:MAG: hypothetical protein COU69_00720 [Candidatus Pacebacteria bacterium CG10_big_fil_rev_8_21_14_0_10_56_10]